MSHSFNTVANISLQVFPTADVIPSARFGNEMSQWFDMWSTEDPHERSNVQSESLGSAVAKLSHIIKEECRVVGGSENVFLAGISQGCATAICALMREQAPFAGFIGLSSWMPTREVLTQTSASKTPVFLSHSRDDEVIAIKYGEDLRDCLVQHGMHVEWHSYEDGGHWVTEPQGIGK